MMSWDGPVLVLAPHTDDAELGCGATIAKLSELGVNVHILVFSSAEASLPEGAKPGELKREFLSAVKHLGVKRENVDIRNYPVRHFMEYRQDILEELIRVKASLRPKIVLLPASSDVHQDHQVIYSEGVRAFKDVTLWGYELPWNHIGFRATGFVSVSAEHLRRKWRALQAYKTQFQLARPYFSREFIWGLAKVRGTQIKGEYAEAFEVVRSVLM